MNRLIELRIEKLVYGGDGIARHDGKVVFVPRTAPGDLVRVRIVEERKTHARGELVTLLAPGPARVEPECPLFGRCGGCQWLHIDYPAQVEFKRSILEDTVRHRLPETRGLQITMKPSPRRLAYRSRVRLHAEGTGESRRAGFFTARSRRLVDVPSCPLLQPSLNRAVAALRAEAPRDGGLPREYDLACAEESGSWTIAERRAGDHADSPPDSSEFRPEELLVRNVRGIKYTVTAGSFFQANDSLIEDLVVRVSELAESPRNDSALDLFSGVGLFTLPLARRYARVAAVEGSPAGAALCALNASDAGAFNVQVAHSDVLGWMRQAASRARPAVDLVQLDPPRTGAGLEVMDAIVQWAPDTVIYVSCDPQTLCRDLVGLRESYEVDHVEGFDLFPQTFHFETAVRLRRKAFGIPG
jgi:23S rRNA (uracil1939-C5)-methyltransferase